MISEAQAKSNQELLARATDDPVNCKLTGKYLKFNEEEETWETNNEKGKEVPAKRMNIRWGWMGKVYGPDDKGMIRELKGRKDGKMQFGLGIPRPGFVHHQQVLRISPTNIDKYEVVEIGAKQDSEK